MNQLREKAREVCRTMILENFEDASGEPTSTNVPDELVDDLIALAFIRTVEAVHRESGEAARLMLEAAAVLSGEFDLATAQEDSPPAGA